jgi:hypothetical protein
MLCAEARARAGDAQGAIADLERFLTRARADDPMLPRARELLAALGR